jgi:hypothetical protein
MDELLGVWLLLLAGRSPDEQFALLRALDCLSTRGLSDRMGLIRLLDRQYQAHVNQGFPPRTPTVMPGSTLADFLTESTAVPGGREEAAQRLARLQLQALVGAGYLDSAACRVERDAVRAWWSDALPRVVAVHDEHNEIFAALATVATKSGQRADPITCPLCGRPAPRGATYCVWCGRWLAAPHV